MSLFEFIMVLFSIIIGLGIAEILTGFAQALLHRRLTIGSWHQLLLSCIVFVTLIQVWWESWRLHDVPEWSFPQLLMLLLNPVLLYTLAHLLFPDSTSSVPLRAHYFDNHRLLYSVVAVTALASLVFHPIVFRTPLFAIHNLSSYLMLAASLALATSRRPTLHSVLLPVGALLVVFDVVAGVFSIS